VNSEGFRETFLRSGRKTQGAKMAGKKDAKHKAGPRGQAEKSKEKTKSSAGTKNASDGSGQRTAQRTQQRSLQEQEEQKLGEGAQDQREVKGKDIQEGWETIKEIDKVLDHLEGRLDRMTAVIRQVAVQGRALEPAMPGESTDRAGSRDSLEELETPALQSSLEEHRIVDIEPRAGAPGIGTPRVEGGPMPSSAESGGKGEEKSERPSLEEQRRRAEEEYDKLGGLSHGCRQSWDLRLREEKGPGRKINGLFHWASGDSLILHVSGEDSRPGGPRIEAESRYPVYGECGIHVRVLGPAHGLEG
jgi:hypothetical protein